MNCKDCCALMDRALTDALASGEKEQMLAHLEQCPSCREEWRRLRSFVEELGQLEQPVPGEMHETIMAALETERLVHEVQPRVKSRRPYFTMVAGLAAVLLLAVSGAFGDVFSWLDRTQESPDAAMYAADSGAPEPGVTPGDSRIIASPSDAADTESMLGQSAQHTVSIADVTVALPDAAVEESYGFVALVLYEGSEPSITEATLLETQEQTAFYIMENNIGALEKLTAQLEGEGCRVELGQGTEVLLESEAASGLIIVKKES